MAPASKRELASLEGRVIAIAGAAGNLGPTVVGRLAPEGARLCLCGREQSKLEAVVADTGAAAADLDVVDLLDADATKKWAQELVSRHGGVDALVHLVGGGAIVTPAMREEAPDKDFSTFTPAEEIAEAIAWLCSDAAASMNGQRLTLRGAY